MPPVFVGSHIDTQPTGGKFDGALGVLAALESIEAMIARGVRPRRTIEIVAWMNEEGSRFAPGMMGSAVFSGARQLEDILGIRDQAGMTVRVRAAQDSFGCNRACRSARSERRRLPFSRPTLSKALFSSSKKRPSGSLPECKANAHFGCRSMARRIMPGLRRAACGAMRSSCCRGHRARTAGRHMGPRGHRALHHRHVHRQSQCALRRSRAGRLLH